MEATLTPIYGGQENGPVCCVLEIDGARLLLDCGWNYCDASQDRAALAAAIDANSIDAVLISHADMTHMGGLPVFFGRHSPVVLCTLPVLKLGQMCLYDHFANAEAEGTTSAIPYSIDALDDCLSRVHPVKYNHLIHVPVSAGRPDIQVCAYPSGRSIGGACWRICAGSKEVLYMMDANLRKEVVLEGAPLDSYPRFPSLLICEGAAMRSASTFSAAGRKRRDKEDGIATLLSLVKDTVRSEGNVLLPMDLAGGSRLLEVLYALDSCWRDNNYTGMYHLALIAPMVHSTVEFVRSQLEWMSDGIVKGFYLGRANPFTLSSVTLCASVAELEELGPGPKVVIASEASLSCGASRDLLMQWGSDPSSRVVFTEPSPAHSLAADIRAQTAPPIIATVNYPEKVYLVGSELEEHHRREAAAARAKEESSQRRKRERELEAALMGRHSSVLNNEGYESEASTSGDESDGNDGVVSMEIAGNEVSLERQESAGGGRKKHRGSSSASVIGRIAKYAIPRYPMFESRERDLQWGDYGQTIDDLSFNDIVTGASVIQKQGYFTLSNKPSAAVNKDEAGAAAHSGGGNTSVLAANTSNGTVKEVVTLPFKMITKKMKIQFTCGFREISLGGRLDAKGVRNVLSTLSPRRLAVIRGSAAECDMLVKVATTMGVGAVSPPNMSSVPFRAVVERMRVVVPLPLMPRENLVHLTVTSAATDGTDSISLGEVSGDVLETATSGKEGIKVVQLLNSAAEGSMASGSNSRRIRRCDIPSSLNAALQIPQLHIGSISVGEVPMQKLQQELKEEGVSVDFQIGQTGGVLLCGNQVVLRKLEDGFSLEGPPCTAYFQARNVLYKQHAFL